MVIITKVLDDEVNARLSGSISNSIVEKINGVKVKGLTHAYELLYPENMPEYVVIELKNGERPLVFEGKAMETANKRISKTYNIPKNARLQKPRTIATSCQDVILEYFQEHEWLDHWLDGRITVTP